MQVCARGLRPSPHARIPKQLRTYATSSGYVPTKSRRDMAPPAPLKPKPTSQTFFTGRASFKDTLLKLEDTIKEAKYSLGRARLLPSNGNGEKGRGRLVVGGAQWKTAEDMAKLFDSAKKLPTGDHRRVLVLLAQLNEYRSLIQQALSNPRTASTLLNPQPISPLSRVFDVPETRKEPTHPLEIYDELDKLLNPFQRASFTSNLARQQAEAASRAEAGDEEATVLKPVGSRAQGSKAYIDELGRAYALGKRKESSARVWLVPAKVPRFREEVTKVQDGASPEVVNKAAVDSPAHARFLEAMQSSFQSPTGTSTSALAPAPSPTGITLTPSISHILVNNTPLHLYFANPIDREKIVFPFKATGTVGKFNVFALVRGGGTTGQAGAVAVGIARAVRTLFPAGTKILKGYNLLRRDPRMVERKKTGLAKARKAYTWVKR